MDVAPPDVTGWTDDQAATVLSVLRAVSAHRDRQRLFRAISEALQPVIDHDVLAITFDGPGRNEITPYVIEPWIVLPPLKRSESILETLFVTGQPIYVPTLDALERYPGSRRVAERFGVQSYLALPLVVRGRVLAALILHSRQPHTYDSANRPFLAELAQVIAVAVDHCISYETIAKARDQLVMENTLLRETLGEGRDPEGTVAESAAMREVTRLIELVGPTDATVLLTGETGSGKERVARQLHARSNRSEQALVTINCAAIPASLIESELFGHEPGAFTGATRRRRGRFELAHRGTLLLDEVGELPLEAQAKLLRVLQHQELERVGGSETIRVDVRVIAATNRDLPAMVADKVFRGDLYYRLAVFPIELPPLWARRDDIPILARQFIAQAARRIGRPAPYLDEDSAAALQRYSWPGNVRELENVIERAVILSRAGMLDVEAVIGEPAVPAPGDLAEGSGDDEGEELRRVLVETSWVIEGEDGAAARLGVKPSTLRSRMRRLGIVRE